MKTLRKLAARCLLAAVGVALALVVVSLSVLVGVGLHEAKNYPYSPHQVGEVAQALRRTGSGFALDAAHTPEEWLQGMLLHLEKRAPKNNDNFTAAAVFVA